LANLKRQPGETIGGRTKVWMVDPRGIDQRRPRWLESKGQPDPQLRIVRGDPSRGKNTEMRRRLVVSAVASGPGATLRRAVSGCRV
jgi:hypothetical protein